MIMRKRSIVLLCMMLLYTQMAAYGQVFNSNQITDYTNGNDAYVTSGNALQVDITSSSGTANVNVSQIGGTATSTGNGVSGAGVQRVTIASDSTGQISLAAGSNLIGSVSQSGVWNIGSVATITNPVAVTGTFWQATQPVSGTFWQATQPVSGTVAVTQSTSPWVGNVTQLGGVSITTGNGISGTGVQRVTIASDSTGQISLAAGANLIGSVSQSGTWNIGTVTTLTGITNVVHVDDNAGSLTVDGTFWQATQPVSGTFWQATQPVSGTFWQATQPVSLASVPTHAVTQSGTWNIGTVTTLTSLDLAQGSTTSGQTGPLIQTATTTAAPTYTTAKTNPLSTTTAGALRVDGSAVTQPVSGTFWQATQPVSGTVAATQSGAWSLTANQSVNAAQINGVTPLMGNGATGTGALRVSIANDSTGIVALTTGSAQIGHLEANQSTNIAQMNGVTVTMGNGVAGTGVQRVAIASDNTAFTVNAVQSGTWNIGTLTTLTGITNVVHVDDNAGSLTVDGTFWQATQPVSLASVPTHAVTQSGTWTVQPGNTANTTPWLATISQGGNSATVDATGALKVTGGGGGTQYAEDAAHVSGDTGNFMLGVRNDAQANLTSTDGDYSPIAVDSAGRLTVNAAQMNGVAVSMGNGSSGTGTQRVTIAADSSGEIQVRASGTSGGVEVRPYAPSGMTCQAAATANGNGTPLDTGDISSSLRHADGGVYFSVTENAAGTFNATINFEADINGTYVALPVTNTMTGVRASTTTVAGHYYANIIGVPHVRARISNYVSGTINVIALGVATSFPERNVTLEAGSAVIGAVTQSGSNWSSNIAQINGVTPLMGNGATGTGALRVSIANDSTGIVALTTGSAQIGHLEANQSVNCAQMNGVAVTMGNGASGTGVQRVTIANDSTGIVALTTGSAQIGHLEANQSSNIAQINGVTPLMGNGASGTGAQRVTIASDSTGVIAVTESGTWNVGLSTGTNSIGKISDITTSVVPGTSATHLGKAEDAGHTTGDTGVFALGVRNDTNAAFSGTDLDYTPIATTSSGSVRAVTEHGDKATYMVCNPQFTVPATPTDMVVFGGSATKTIKILKVTLFAIRTTASTNEAFFLIKRTVADTLGTPVSTTPQPLDSNSSGATATMNHYTANPTLGAGVTLTNPTLFVGTVTSGAPASQPAYVLFDEKAAGQPIVLRGTAQQLALNFNGATLPAGMKVQMEVIFTEE
jgi:hypothetical protein